MTNYLGIVIKQSLKNATTKIDIIAQKFVGSWDFMLVRVEDHHLDEHIKELQGNMIGVEEDCWYNHYFRDNELIIVYQDRVFYSLTDPESWNDVIQYGLNHGVPKEQLDFKPRTENDAYEFFNIPLKR